MKLSGLVELAEPLAPSELVNLCLVWAGAESIKWLEAVAVEIGMRSGKGGSSGEPSSH